MPLVERIPEYLRIRGALHFLGLGIVRPVVPVSWTASKHPGPEEIPVGLEGQARGIAPIHRIPTHIRINDEPRRTSIVVQGILPKTASYNPRLDRCS